MALDFQKEKLMMASELQQLGVKGSAAIKIDEFLERADQKLKREFDRTLAGQLIIKMEQDEDNRILPSKIQTVFVEGVYVLAKKIKEITQDLKEYSEEREKAVEKLNAHIQTEKKNEFNITEGSLLFIRLIDCDFGGIDTPQILVQFETQNAYLETNKVAQFPIRTGIEEIAICSQDKSTKLIFALAYLMLSRLKDQKPIEQWLVLDSIKGQNEEIHGKVKVQLHWVNNTSTFLEDLVVKWNDHITKAISEIEEFSLHLNEITSLFPSLNEVVNKTNASFSMRKSTFGVARQGSTMKLSLLKQSGKGQDIEAPHEIIQTAAESTDVSKTIIYSLFIYLLLGLIISVQRTVFMDFVIGFSFFINLSQSQLPSRWKYYILVLLVSILMDIYAIVLITTAEIVPMTVGENKMKTAIIGLSIMFFISKIELVALFLLMRSPETQQSYLNSPKKASTIDQGKDLKKIQETQNSNGQLENKSEQQIQGAFLSKNNSDVHFLHQLQPSSSQQFNSNPVSSRKSFNLNYDSFK